jgi:hypothetical protein
MAGAVPDAGERPTHAALADATHESAPPPVFVIEIPCAAGVVPPAV